MKKLVILAGAIFLNLWAFSQTAPFQIYIEPMSITNLGGIQAYAYGQWDGKWLIIGGRLDGLHRRQPFASFDIAGNNNKLFVVDPTTEQIWSSPVTTLPVDIQEQLSSTNMEFHQTENYLYIIGGYGYNTSSASRKTFDKLTAIDISGLISAIIGNSSINNYFRQITDSKFAVTGGHLKRINNTYYLVGGNRFDGNYNPMGNPTYTQVYTNAIRKFNLIDDGANITINHLPEITDANNLHRRDYNAVSQILPNGSEGITVFSGVFQPNIDLPYLNSVTIDSLGYSVDNTFQQYYNHYHCAVMPLYSTINNEMHNVFFGGIAQYYDSLGVLVQDNNVPFVKTIARVTRSSNNSLAEYKLPIEMPAYLGAGAEFILNEGVPTYNNEVIKLDELTDDTTLVGYIYGGINSPEKNIFFINTGIESTASSQIFKVYIINNNVTAVDMLNSQSVGSLKLMAYPNPNDGNFNITFTMQKQGLAKATLWDGSGKLVEEKIMEKLPAGENNIHFKIKKRFQSGHYLITVETAFEKAIQKIIIE